jgi:hypothetical protein
VGCRNYNNKKPSIYFGIKINYLVLVGVPVMILDDLIYKDVPED